MRVGCFFSEVPLLLRGSAAFVSRASRRCQAGEGAAASAPTSSRHSSGDNRGGCILA